MPNVIVLAGPNGAGKSTVSQNDLDPEAIRFQETIRRRYERGLANLFASDMPLAERWSVFKSSEKGIPEVASGGKDCQTVVSSVEDWKQVCRGIES